MEECIFEQPFPGPGREVTCAVLGGGIYPAADPSLGQRLHVQPMGCVLRNCYFNFDYINPRPGNAVPVHSSLYSAGTSDVTVTTQFPAAVAVDDFVEIYGSDAAGLNGRWKVTAVLAADPTSKLVLSFKVALGSSGREQSDSKSVDHGNAEQSIDQARE